MSPLRDTDYARYGLPCSRVRCPLPAPSNCSPAPSEDASRRTRMPGVTRDCPSQCVTLPFVDLVIDADDGARDELKGRRPGPANSTIIKGKTGCLSGAPQYKASPHRIPSGDNGGTLTNHTRVYGFARILRKYAQFLREYAFPAQNQRISFPPRTFSSPPHNHACARNRPDPH